MRKVHRGLLTEELLLAELRSVLDVGAEAVDALSPFVRVTGVSFDGVARAWSQNWLRTRRVVHERVGDQDVVVLFTLGTTSPLDTADTRPGATSAAARSSRRSSTGGSCASGPTATAASPTSRRGRRGRSAASPSTVGGRRLAPLPHQDAFWFAWAAFNPETSLRGS